MPLNSLRAEPASSPGAMTSGRFKINLGKDAVKLALAGEWERAAELNRAILELHPDDSEAANRLAKALMELADYVSARRALNDLLTRRPNNSIARKNLARLERLESQQRRPPTLSVKTSNLPPVFIEEGGKSCATTIRHHGEPTALADIAAGDTVTLSICGESVLVHSPDGKRLGAIETRLARRLRKLMNNGNRYCAAVVSIDGDAATIVIRETERHPALRHVVSFPPRSRGGGPDLESPNIEVDEIAESPETLNTTSDPNIEPDQEASLLMLATQEVDDDDDDDGPESGFVIPVLDADDMTHEPVLPGAPLREDDWE